MGGGNCGSLWFSRTLPISSQLSNLCVWSSWCFLVILSMSAESVMTALVSFLILVFCVFPLPSFVCFVRGLSILSIFSRKQLFVLLFLSIIVLCSDLVISAFTFMISFFMLDFFFFFFFLFLFSNVGIWYYKFPVIVAGQRTHLCVILFLFIYLFIF